MPTDNKTGIIWSLMLIRGVIGKYDRVLPDTFNVVENDWETIKTHFKEANFYNEFVEGADLSNDIETETTNQDYYRFGIKSWIKKQTVHIFNYDLFDGEGLLLKNAFVNGGNVLVLGNKNLNFTLLKTVTLFQ
ncbi:MAG TPA: hypothetical protein ENH87_14775 [Pricia antarctica]|uniref:Uncharacterized protein n=1 Tax=Pricia antarctica TaxID=641691 RepID=A0A831QSS7_9FLAO|nr:hypothetical protein [Pricia antarctica]